jgi:hypothetical protein
MVVVCIAIACGTSAVNWYCGIMVVVVCVCGASAVRLRIAAVAVVEVVVEDVRLQLDSCRLVVVESLLLWWLLLLSASVRLPYWPSVVDWLSGGDRL